MEEENFGCGFFVGVLFALIFVLILAKTGSDWIGQVDNYRDFCKSRNKEFDYKFSFKDDNQTFDYYLGCK